MSAIPTVTFANIVKILRGLKDLSHYNMKDLEGTPKHVPTIISAYINVILETHKSALHPDEVLEHVLLILNVVMGSAKRYGWTEFNDVHDIGVVPVTCAIDDKEIEMSCMIVVEELAKIMCMIFRNNLFMVGHMTAELTHSSDMSVMSAREGFFNIAKCIMDLGSKQWGPTFKNAFNTLRIVTTL